MPAAATRTLIDSVTDSFKDLVLGGRCVGCERPGRALCARCWAGLPEEPQPAWPVPAPAGLAFPWAAAPYADVVRAMVVAHKERQVFALRRPLGLLLAGAVARAVSGPAVLVPVPSRPGSARARGHDPTYALTRTAAHVLRSGGQSAMPARLLVSRGGVLDQAGLDAAARAANLAGSMSCPSPGVRRLAGQRVRAVVCDDVLTTGATAREAQRALEAAGLDVAGVATVAATPRRHPGRSDAAPTVSSNRDSPGVPLSSPGYSD